MIFCMSALLRVRIRHRRRREIGEKFVHRLDILRGLVFQLIGGVVRVAEQRRAFRAQLHRAQNDLARVPFAAVTVPRRAKFA